jgi:hypothetical protein
VVRHWNARIAHRASSGPHRRRSPSRERAHRASRIAAVIVARHRGDARIAAHIIVARHRGNARIAHRRAHIVVARHRGNARIVGAHIVVARHRERASLMRAEGT